LTRFIELPINKDTILFLDAFDEDPEAVQDHRRRLQELMEAGANFRRVVVTCRTQFFRSDEEIPKEPGVAIVAPRRAGQTRQYRFFKLYLLPFTEDQVEAYVRKRFPAWQRRRRRAARDVINAIPELSLRPMLLAVVPDLIEQRRTITELFELYEFMVDSWLERESSWIDKERLRAFSEMLAVDVFLNRKIRSFERIPRAALVELIEVSAADLDQWRLTARSLLNRDAAGNYKFAHRSIMEYLFVVAFLKGDQRCLSVEWTDLRELFVSSGHSGIAKLFGQWSLELDFRKTGLFPLENPRSEPQSLSRETALERGQLRSVEARHFELPPQWRRDLVSTRETQDETVLVFDRARDLVWIVLEPRRAEINLYRFRFEELDKVMAAGRLKGRAWRTPTLEEFDTLYAFDRSLHADERLFSGMEFYWTSDWIVGGGQIVVSVGDEEVGHSWVRHIGVRNAARGGEGLGRYHVYEVVAPHRRPFAVREEFSAQLARVSPGGAEELWHGI
jgi:hypothetical protein